MIDWGVYRYFSISSHRGDDIIKDSYLTFTNGLIESLPKFEKEE